MNCKPHQMARIISTRRTRAAGLADKFIKTTEIKGLTALGYPAWGYEGPLLRDGQDGREIVAIGDHVLRPINNPGDDAKDEMVRLVGPAPKVAMKDKVKA